MIRVWGFLGNIYPYRIIYILIYFVLQVWWMMGWKFNCYCQHDLCHVVVLIIIIIIIIIIMRVLLPLRSQSISRWYQPSGDFEKPIHPSISKIFAALQSIQDLLGAVGQLDLFIAKEVPRGRPLLASQSPVSCECVTQKKSPWNTPSRFDWLPQPATLTGHSNQQGNLIVPWRDSDQVAISCADPRIHELWAPANALPLLDTVCTASCNKLAI